MYEDHNVNDHEEDGDVDEEDDIDDGDNVDEEDTNVDDGDEKDDGDWGDENDDVSIIIMTRRIMMMMGIMIPRAMCFGSNRFLAGSPPTKRR